jgi:hypothetical protein
MDLFRKRCGCGTIHPVRQSCPSCARKKRALVYDAHRGERAGSRDPERAGVRQALVLGHKAPYAPAECPHGVLYAPVDGVCLGCYLTRPELLALGYPISLLKLWSRVTG